MAIDCYCPPESAECEDGPVIVEESDEYSYLPLRRDIDEYIVTLDAREFAPDRPLAIVREPSPEDRFNALANRWEQETGHISSVSDLTGNAHYRQIVQMGWDVVPFLLKDLQERKRFWFPALAEITGIRPFDPQDKSNPRRMMEAWLRWGKRKDLI